MKPPNPKPEIPGLPPQPTDKDISAFAQFSVLNDDIDAIERFIFENQALSPAWVLYIAVTSSACVVTNIEQTKQLENIIRRGLDLDDALVIVELVIDSVINLYKQFHDEDGIGRCIDLRWELRAILQLQDSPDAP